MDPCAGWPGEQRRGGGRIGPSRRRRRGPGRGGVAGAPRPRRLGTRRAWGRAHGVESPGTRGPPVSPRRRGAEGGVLRRRAAGDGQGP
ncbi:MAG: hypothetical protein D6729_05065 [Deltaproteobacteria bacterium]|nr:MAG: hypothetical protein D6729_05065 [Deltaproteobacteria bacterium]